jgi:hypothetical protein
MAGGTSATALGAIARSRASVAPQHAAAAVAENRRGTPSGSRAMETAGIIAKLIRNPRNEV